MKGVSVRQENAYQRSLITAAREGRGAMMDVKGKLYEEYRAKSVAAMKEARDVWAEKVRAAREAGVSWSRLAEGGAGARSTLQKLAQEYGIK